jgi:hypothetical protein
MTLRESRLRLLIRAYIRYAAWRKAAQATARLSALMDRQEATDGR